MPIARRIILWSCTHGVAALLAIGVSGCVAEASAPLRVGLNPWPGYEFLYLAQELGIYRELDLDVRIIELDTLGDVRRSFERGQIDVMGCTIVEMLQARQGSPHDPVAVFVPERPFGNPLEVALQASP